MAKLSRNALIGYPAGIITGITYGLNPLFAKPLMNNGASVLGVFEPITAILVGTLVFGEALTTNIITGILISVVAVTFMIIVTKR